MSKYVDLVIINENYKKINIDVLFELMNQIMIDLCSIKNIPVAMEYVSEKEFEEETKITVDQWINVKDPKTQQTHRIRVADSTHDSDIVANLRYGRFEVHMFNENKTIIYPIFNIKAYQHINNLDILVHNYAQFLSQSTPYNELVYMMSNLKYLSKNMFEYMIDGRITHKDEGKDCYTRVRDTYGLDINDVIRVMLENMDIEMAPKDINVLEDNIRAMSEYIPFVSGAKNLDSIEDENAKEMVRWGVESLKELKRQRDQITDLITSESQMYYKFFKIISVKL